MTARIVADDDAGRGCRSRSSAPAASSRCRPTRSTGSASRSRRRAASSASSRRSGVRPTRQSCCSSTTRPRRPGSGMAAGRGRARRGVLARRPHGRRRATTRRVPAARRSPAAHRRSAFGCRITPHRALWRPRSGRCRQRRPTSPGCRRRATRRRSPPSSATSSTCILDGGVAHGGPASTVVDCTGDRPAVLRVGAIPLERVAEVLDAAAIAHAIA